MVHTTQQAMPKSAARNVINFCTLATTNQWMVNVENSATQLASFIYCTEQEKQKKYQKTKKAICQEKPSIARVSSKY